MAQQHVAAAQIPENKGCRYLKASKSRGKRTGYRGGFAQVITVGPANLPYADTGTEASLKAGATLVELRLCAVYWKIALRARCASVRGQLFDAAKTAIAGDCRAAQCGQVHAVQSADGNAAGDRDGRTRDYAGPDLWQGGMARAGAGDCRYRRDRS